MDGGKPQAGVKITGRIYPAGSLASGLENPNTVLGLLQQWDKARPILKAAV
jgi:hypothetical protein